MKAFLISDIKVFMSGLLSGSLFKDWEFRSLDMGLLVRIHLDGKRNLTYLPEEQRDGQSEYIKWDEIQSKVRMLIQGGNTPSFMNLTMAIPPQRMKDIISDVVESYQLNPQEPVKRRFPRSPARYNDFVLLLAVRRQSQQRGKHAAAQHEQTTRNLHVVT